MKNTKHIMQISESDYANLLPVQSYESGKLKINGETFNHPVILRFGGMPTQWTLKHVPELTLALLQPLLEDKPEVILLGSGTKPVFPAMELIQEVTHQGIGIEVMDTGAACRTYNLLLAEGRKVVAGLIL